MPSLAELDVLFEGSRRRSAILDTNLLVLWISHRAGLPFGSFKRTRIFSGADADLLESILSRFGGVVTTAYVLAEASNLGNALSGHNRDLWFEELAAFSRNTVEAHVPTEAVGGMQELVRFGVADAALTKLSQSFTLITLEFKLAGYLRENGTRVVNFNDFRLPRLLSD